MLEYLFEKTSRRFWVPQGNHPRIAISQVTDGN